LLSQKTCLEYLSMQIEKLVYGLEKVEIIFCSDHGGCLGEDGLWGHYFYHNKVITVPIGYLKI